MLAKSFKLFKLNNTLKTICFSTVSKKRLFTDKHEWISVENNIGVVGISDYAQEKLGDVVYVQLPDVGIEINQDDECGTVESVKAASEIYTPVSGKIQETNSRLESESGLLNKSPYDDGWLFKILLSKPEELKELMDDDAYKKFLEEDS